MLNKGYIFVPLHYRKRFKMRLVCDLLILMGLCHGVSKAAQCPAQGRYPNNDTEDCRGYTMCLIGGVSNFTQYKLTCPEGFMYSHLEQQCTNTTSYKCLQSYECSTVGDFVNPYTDNCSSFVSCVPGISDLVTARWIECTNNTVFNPNILKCVNESEYNCNFKSIDLSFVVSNSFETSSNFAFNSSNCVSVQYVVIIYLLFIMFSQ